MDNNQQPISPADIKVPQPLDPSKIINPNAGGSANTDTTKPTGSTEDIMLDIKADSETFYNKKKKKKIEINGAMDIYNAVNDWMINSSKVKLQDKLIFFELLGATINAGVSITEALRMIEVQTKNPKLRIIIRDIRLLIEEGSSLAEAFRKNDDVFDEATCAIVEAGEKSGKLNEVLKELIKQYERMSGIRKKVMGVMMYPIIVVCVIVLLIVVVLIFVVPKLVGIFGSVENLPLPTQILVYGSDLFLKKYILLITTVGTIAFSFITWKKSYAGTRQWATFVFYIPIVGMLMRDMILSRVTRIFGFLMSSGVPILESLKITANVSQHPLYEDKLLLAADDLERGITIAENLADNERLFPMMLVNMIAIGEKTASLETIMGKIADFYDDELDRKVSNLSKLMEPIILAIIAAMAVFMILAIYLPITQLNDQFIDNTSFIVRTLFA